MPTINIERRAKRHAWAPEHRFFAVTAPGLEQVCAAELTALNAKDVRAVPGGVEFSGGLDKAYAANLWLRTAGRVLLRLKDFRVRGWPDLGRQAASVPWEVWLAPQAPLKVQVSLSQSNLKHSGHIAEEVFNAAAKHMQGLGLASPAPAQPGDESAQRLMVRAQGRRAVFSLDTSGAHLHKRGYRAMGGVAPLREDLAAALIMLCNYSGEAPLLDPMCGSGTLAIEAAFMARRLAPGAHRGFDFENWPCHRPATWQHLQKQAASQALERGPHAILARDRQAAAVRLALDNAARAGVAKDLALEMADFFQAATPAKTGVVVLNPPYGKRLGSVRQARIFMERVARKLRKSYAGWQCGVVLYRPEWAGPLGLTEKREAVASFGGLTVTLLSGKVPQN